MVVVAVAVKLSIQVEIEDRNPDGRGRGDVGGRVALVSQAHPGEVVQLRVDKSTKGTLQGRVQALVERNESRIKHACGHEFLCTGCPFLAATLDEERAFKRARILAAVATVAEDPEALVEAVRVPTEPFGYRHYAKQVFTLKKGRVVLGAYVQGTHEVADNRGCPVLVPKLAALMGRVTALAEKHKVGLHRPDKKRAGLRYAVARQSRAKGKQLLVLVTSSHQTDDAEALCQALVEDVGALAGAHLVINDDPGNALLAGELRYVAGEKAIDDSLGGHVHTIGPRSFFQINPVAAEVMFQAALEAAGSGPLCIEGYAGVGAATLSLADRFERVIAIENNAEAAASLKAAAGSVEVITDDVAAVLPELLSEHPGATVVLDPPRKGLGAELATALGRSDLGRLVLLSCGPEALGRDLPRLLAGALALETVIPVDQFPRTAHIETVTVLARAPS